MSDVRMLNQALDADIDEIDRQAENMMQAIAEFTSLVQANLENFQGMTAEELTTQCNELNRLAGGMANTFNNAGDTLTWMIQKLNDADRRGGVIVAG
ncbi:hypothetical protein Kisp01_71820 [Kineosporia sp. NBRC 101677]|uniref:hypothetical protein n=1 Tax=Kineosporia sp. NBRC 101677 TaxID=3032197 RepID=UPI0024A10687|nr:hypothetical protein [Kineosporia sp. NBRC 101677]GLY20168.1 hypothetical protein Kisp01_71820 [Kineosporia sp. NBRC 101677]